MPAVYAEMLIVGVAVALALSPVVGKGYCNRLSMLRVATAVICALTAPALLPAYVRFSRLSILRVAIAVIRALPALALLPA